MACMNPLILLALIVLYLTTILTAFTLTHRWYVGQLEPLSYVARIPICSEKVNPNAHLSEYVQVQTNGVIFPLMLIQFFYFNLQPMLMIDHIRRSKGLGGRLFERMLDYYLEIEVLFQNIAFGVDGCSLPWCVDGH